MADLPRATSSTSALRDPEASGAVFLVISIVRRRDSLSPYERNSALAIFPKAQLGHLSRILSWISL